MARSFIEEVEQFDPDVPEPMMTTDDDFDVSSLKRYAVKRYATGQSSWVGVWGTNGP